MIQSVSFSDDSFFIGKSNHYLSENVFSANFDLILLANMRKVNQL